ncbi:MAG TPA: adenylosuccinate lyase, partial [Pseudolysinimonas sp.]
RSPLTRLADALVELSDALGTIGANVALLARTEIGELDDGADGASSAMPHKANPVRAVLLTAASRQAPALAAQLHGAASTVDERPDGAWHAEWQTLRMLLRTVGGSAATGVELARDLRVHEDRIAANVEAARDELLAERAGYVAGSEDAAASPSDYLGDAGLLTDRLIAAARRELA